MTADPQRMCPTRLDGRVSLFAHRIGVARCQEQQRACFHKCYSCEWNNAHQAQKTQTRRAKSLARPKPESVPVLEIGTRPQGLPEHGSLPELPDQTAQFVPSTTE